MLLYFDVFEAQRNAEIYFSGGVFRKQIFGTNVRSETARPNIRLGKKVKWVLFRSHINKGALFYAVTLVFFATATSTRARSNLVIC